VTPVRRILTWPGILIVLLSAVGAPAHGAHAAHGPDGTRPGRAHDGGSLGIRLLEASSNRRDDPRARVFIVDHMNPGTSISRRFEVRNSSGRDQHVKIYAGAAHIEGHQFIPAAERDANELSSWVSVDRRELVLPPNGRATLRATIDIPKSASRGERYGAIWAEVSSPTASGKAVRMVNRVGIRIYLDVGPGGDPPSDFAVDQLLPGRAEDGTPLVQATVRNTGERALDVSGRLWLSDGPGGLSAGPFPTRSVVTLAVGAEAPVLVELDDHIPDGPWQVELALESGRVRHTVTGTLTFPLREGTWGLPALLDSFLPKALIVAGAIATAILVLLVSAMVYAHRRNRRRTLA
jgi:hypothetical protein